MQADAEEQQLIWHSPFFAVLQAANADVSFIPVSFFSQGKVTAARGESVETAIV